MSYSNFVTLSGHVGHASAVYEIAYTKINENFDYSRLAFRALFLYFMLKNQPSSVSLKAMNTSDTKRPLSPHLQVYRLPYNAVMSIAGRFTGIALFIALCVILAWFCAVVWSPALFEATTEFLRSDIILPIITGKLILGAFAVFFYIGNGVRHVLWDNLIGLKPETGVKTGNIVLGLAALLTLGLAALICL